MKTKLLTLFALLGIQLTQAEEKLGYVFEFVRHGARAPQLAEPGVFKVPTGMLTSSGQRQRYLIGSLNKAKYFERAGLIDEVYNPTQVYIQSTNVFRAIQSSYAELIGIYPPNQQAAGLTSGEKDSLKSGKGMPKLKIRNTEASNDDSMDGFQYIPVFNYFEPNPKDDLLTQGCKYIDDSDKYFYPRNETYTDVADFILPIVRGPLQQAYELTDDQAWKMSFVDVYQYSDSSLAEDFEGVPRRYNYTAEQWYYLRNAQKFALTLTFPDEYKKIYITKMFRNPLQAMHQRIFDIQDGDHNRDTLRYFIYSAHDYQIANILEWLNPVDHDFVDVPYGSQVFIELFYDTDCIYSLRDESCFNVRLSHNGMPLKLDTCLEGNANRGSHSERCTYTDFRKHIAKISYNDTFDNMCGKQFTPPQP
eukprot:403345675